MKGFSGKERSPLSTQGLQGLWRQMQRLIMMWRDGKDERGSEEKKGHEDNSCSCLFNVDYSEFCILHRDTIITIAGIIITVEQFKQTHLKYSQVLEKKSR